MYGTNAVGKSSFIKAIGISIIMAQAGFFVPAKTFSYYPYQHIFTRILGNDNIFKGLSSFAVEMIEFKSILDMANSSTLILGDELCSGTETNSAISIFVAGVEYLYSVKSNFIFATHFHEITKMDEIKNKEKLLLKHMAVKYNKETDELVYDRKLLDGPGESMYGLEVCKGLHLPEDFLNRAHKIRKKYNNSRNDEDILSLNKSHFNSKKLMGICELCKKEKGHEIHHLQHQSKAKNNGYIQSFHKNHLGNLISVCFECHKKLHQNNNGHIKISHESDTVLNKI